MYRYSMSRFLTEEDQIVIETLNVLVEIVKDLDTNRRGPGRGGQGGRPGDMATV